MINLGDVFLRLHSEIEAEEQCGPINGIAEIALHQEKREGMERQLALVASAVHLLRQRFGRLPALPDLLCIRWAQSVLAYPNGRMLSVDTASAAEGGGIVRVLLQDFHGMIHLDRYVAPGCALPKQTMKASGITMQELHEAPLLPQIWPSLLEALMGQYVVSYDLQRVRQALEEGAEDYKLDPPAVIGGCLRQQCMRYFHAAGFVGLESLCKLIGFPLPEPPNCTAIDRAWGQLHLLQAMAQGISGESPEILTQREQDDEFLDDLF
jgi:DNA polymerase III epsilon subunit-like protein